MHARVFGTVTNPETGGYTAVMSSLPGHGSPFSVQFCDGSSLYRFVPDGPPPENGEFNIEIPENRIAVEVVDKATNLPVEGATVTLAALVPKEDASAHYAGPAGRTDENGRFVLEPILRNRELAICARHQEYESECADRFTMKDTREKSVRLALQKANVRRGRIASGQPTYGQLIWFSFDGRIAEMVGEFNSEGDFTYKKPHAEGEIVVLISADQPLYAFRHPPLRDQQLFEIAIPNAPRRTFSVTLSPNTREDRGFLALQIGDVIVPSNALGWHLMRRRIQSLLLPGATLNIPDVLETGPISVILVPLDVWRNYEGTRIEMPLIPEFGSFPRQRLDSSNTITFQ